MKVTETQKILTSLHNVSRDTCTKHGKDIKTRYFGSLLILESKKDLCFMKQDRTQLFFEEHFQPIVLSMFVSSTTTKDFFETRSLLEEVINRVLQLNRNSFNNHLEKHFKLVLPSQPNFLNPLKIERENL